MKLFAICIGGEHSQAHVEMPDVRFVVAPTVRDTYARLRANWQGTPGTRHMDCWAEIDNADSYDVTLHPAQITARYTGQAWQRIMAFMKAWIPLLALAGCAELPRDPDATPDRVTHEHRIRIGRIDGGSATAWRGVVARIAALTGARPVVRQGMLEAPLLDLEADNLDLVVGARFDRSKPCVAGAPLARIEGERSTAEHVVVRNGENAWIMLVERAARADAR